MKLVKAFALFVIMLALSTGAARVALAQEAIAAEPAIYAGHYYFDFGTGAMYVPKGGAQTQLAGDVYNNTNPAPAPNFGFSSTDFAAQWGDRLATTGTGILQENDFTVFNSAGGSLISASFNINLFDGTTLASLGGYTTGTVSFGAGLPAGSFSIITITGLGGLNINVNTTDVIMLQQIAAKTGTTTRLGIASLDPPSIGTSANTMYINASTVGPAGFYNIGTAPNFLNANPGYRVNVNQPVPADTKSWGALKALYR
jgi:hypothetical protein